MITEDLRPFIDGQVVKHPATVVGAVSTGVVAQDDSDTFFLLPTEDPELLEVGTILDADTLLPIVGLQKELARLMKGV
ncbi:MULTISPECIES: hypothetical protein [Caproicibacterium]|uniref:Uncharacterized protein n=1 Tax=Caproicibacterium argilliputei TaxID=3030016 RepID=A0AA97H247_9FIRM|nr:hypothetical protein [Caproicibacterium argilliputei]WOC32370.1 hypothetical protein PXC00_00450 [Caproicibacterium argilliputei]